MVKDMTESVIDKMKKEQIIYNLDKANVKFPMQPDMSIYEEWLSRIFDNNKELFRECKKEDFINNVLYGTK